MLAFCFYFCFFVLLVSCFFLRYAISHPLGPIDLKKKDTVTIIILDPGSEFYH